MQPQIKSDILCAHRINRGDNTLLLKCGVLLMFHQTKRMKKWSNGLGRSIINAQFKARTQDRVSVFFHSSLTQSSMSSWRQSTIGLQNRRR